MHIESETFELAHQALINIDNVFPNNTIAKRVKKELIDLYNMEFQNAVLKPSERSSIAIIIPISFRTVNCQMKFELRLDPQYPFDAPQLWLAEANKFCGQCKDLLHLILREDQRWQASMNLFNIVENLHKAAYLIQKTEVPLGRYHEFEDYGIDQLKSKHLILYNCRQTWKTLLVRRKADKVLAFGSNVVLKLQPKGNHLVLEFWKPINELLKISYNRDKNILTLFYVNNNKQTSFSMTDLPHSEEILRQLNPIQMLEESVKEAQDNKTVSQELVQDYGQLVTYYSKKNQGKAKEYLGKMNQTIAKLSE